MSNPSVPYESNEAAIMQPFISIPEQLEIPVDESSEVSRRHRIGEWIGNTKPVQWLANTRPGQLAGIGHEEFRRASVGQKLGLFTTGLFVAYEWGPGNEVVTPLIAGRVLTHTDGLASVIATSVVAGGFTAVEQIASGSTAAYAGSSFPRLAKTTYELYNEDNGDRKPWKDSSFGKRFSYAFAIGSTFAVIREAAVTGKTEKGKLTRTAVSSAAISSTAVAALGAGAGALKMIPETAPEYVTKPADIALTVIENPYTWLGLAAYYLTSPALMRRFGKNKAIAIEPPVETEALTNEKDG